MVPLRARLVSVDISTHPSRRIGAQRCARRVLAVLVLLGAALGTRAADTNAVFAAWFAARTNLATWSADFTQTRHLRALAQPLISTGRLWVALPDRFRWELGDPAQTIALRTANELQILYPRLKRAERYDLGASQGGPWRDALALLEAGFPRSRSEIESRFRLLSLTDIPAGYELALQPRSDSARRMMTELRIRLAADQAALLSTELVFADGSRLRNDFTNARRNPPIDDALFSNRIPEGFTVTEPLKR